MPTDPTIDEKAERLGLTKCGCGAGLCVIWFDGDKEVHDGSDIDALYAERFLSEPKYAVIPPGPVTIDCPTNADGYIFVVGGTVLIDTTKPAPDYRAALEALVIAAARVEAGAHVYYDADRDALLSALTHARKVLHGQ